MKGLITGLALVGIGAGSFWAWKQYSLTPENDTSVAIKLGIGNTSDYVPQLPIHPKSQKPTMGIYTPMKVSGKYKSGITLARNTDYLNPAQLYATTGPTGLTPTRLPDASVKDREDSLV